MECYGTTRTPIERIKMSKLTYLASPYSKFPGGRRAAYVLACNKAAELMLKGENIFCPIAHSHAVEVIGMDTVQNGDWWLKQDFAILERCDKLIVYKMEGWEQSHGVAEEIKFAQGLEIPVEYVT
jgi:hypothetical protein